MSSPYLTACRRSAASALVALLLGGAVAGPASASGGGGLGVGSSASGGGGLGSGSGSTTGTGSGGRSGAGSGAGGRSGAGSGAGGRHGGHRRTRVAPGRLLIRGGGDGHGVGMSQYGAEGYALHGASDAAILAHYYTGTALGRVSPSRPVTVLLADGPAVTFTGATAAGPARLVASRTYTASDVGGSLEISGGGARRIGGLSASVTVTGPGPLRTAGAAYRGSLRLSVRRGGGVQAVNVVGLDAYVRGVVVAEMPSSWAPAALEAQAIAARTYAITTPPAGAGFDVYDDTRSQMYGGVGAETAPSDAAVAATSGRVVTDGGRPVLTPFFASSGGHTESVQNAWAGSPADPWLVGVRDPYDGAARDPYHHWSRQMTLAVASARLGSLCHGRLQRIVVTRRGVSPRVMSARVVATRGTTTVTGDQLAAAFGLASTWMSFTFG